MRVEAGRVDDHVGLVDGPSAVSTPSGRDPGDPVGDDVTLGRVSAG